MQAVIKSSFLAGLRALFLAGIFFFSSIAAAEVYPSPADVPSYSPAYGPQCGITEVQVGNESLNCTFPTQAEALAECQYYEQQYGHSCFQYGSSYARSVEGDLRLIAFCPTGKRWQFNSSHTCGCQFGLTENAQGECVCESSSGGETYIDCDGSCTSAPSESFISYFLFCESPAPDTSPCETYIFDPYDADAIIRNGWRYYVFYENQPTSGCIYFPNSPFPNYVFCPIRLTPYPAPDPDAPYCSSNDPVFDLDNLRFVAGSDQVSTGSGSGTGSGGTGSGSGDGSGGGSVPGEGDGEVGDDSGNGSDNGSGGNSGSNEGESGSGSGSGSGTGSAPCGTPGTPCSIDDSGFSGTQPTAGLSGTVGNYFDSLTDKASELLAGTPFEIDTDWIPNLGALRIQCAPIPMSWRGYSWVWNWCPYINLLRDVWAYVLYVLTAVYIWRNLISTQPKV